MAQPEQTWRVLRGSVSYHLPQLQGQQFDWIYCDPPYQSRLYDAVLEAVSQGQLLAPTGEMALEYEEKYWRSPAHLGNLIRIREKRYGRSHLVFYAPQIPPEETTAE